MSQLDLFYSVGVALFIGILIGMQREHTYDLEERPDEARFAGVRTFSLMALAGWIGALLSDVLGSPLVYVTVVLVVGALVTVAYVRTARAGGTGLTTEVAALVTLLVGSVTYAGQHALAVALAVVVLALLSLKIELHRFAERITREDVRATVKFAIVTAVILPVLPNRSFGPAPFDVLNPYNVWLMVVLISAISFLGYVLVKVVGPHRGIAVTGLLGGLASSTAVTLSMTARSRSDEGRAGTYAMAILLAWVVMFVRVLVEVAVVNRRLLVELWLPMAGAGVVALLAAAYLYRRESTRPHQNEELPVSNPFELKPALGFGLLYAVILLLTRSAQLYLGDAGIYASSVASGLADVDAITLSMAELAGSGGLSPAVAGTAVVLAAASNTVVKVVMALSGGTPRLRRALLPGFGVIVATMLALALLF